MTKKLFNKLFTRNKKGNWIWFNSDNNKCMMSIFYRNSGWIWVMGNIFSGSHDTPEEAFENFRESFGELFKDIDEDEDIVIPVKAGATPSDVDDIVAAMGSDF